MEQPVNTRAVSLVEANQQPMGVQLVNSNMTNKMSSAGDLVQLAQQVQKGDEFIRANATNKLTVIADQIRYLQEQAKKVLEDAKRDSDLHHAACNMVKKPGTVYYLYRRESGQTYLSLLSPQEWGPSCPHEFLEGYRLEHDMSYTPLEKIEQRSQENAVLDKVLNAKLAITDATGFNNSHPSPPTVQEV